MEKLKEFATDSKNNTIMKQHDEKLDVALTDIYKREQDRIRLKTQEVLQKVFVLRPAVNVILN